MAGVNLHIHSTCSDGTLSINEIIATCIELKMAAISITDHGNADGIIDLQQVKDITVISGVELECSYEECVLHLLGYDFRPLSLKRRLHELSVGDELRRTETLNKLLQCGVVIDRHDVQRLLNTPREFRRNVAEILINNGYAHSMREAFTKYLGAPGVAYVPPVATASDVISLLTEIGGVPVFAHPHKFYRGWPSDKIVGSIERLKGMGLKGIEAYCWDSTSEDVKFYSHVAEEFNLIATGGSDFHTPMLQPLQFDFPNSGRCISLLTGFRS